MHFGLFGCWCVPGVTCRYGWHCGWFTVLTVHIVCSCCVLMQLTHFYLTQLSLFVWLGLLISLCSNFWSASHNGLSAVVCCLSFLVRFWAFHSLFCGEFDPGSG